MANEFKLPELGENIESGDVVGVLVSVGDTVSVDQPILELETDKATLEVPSGVSGVVKEIHVKEGDTASVGQVILTVVDDGDSGAAASDNGAQAQSAPEPEPEPTPEPAADSSADNASASSGPVEFVVPDLGENITSGTVVGVLVAEGDTIEIDQPVLELETDKATLEVPSEVAGKVIKIHMSEGQEAGVGQTILTVESSSGGSQPAAEPPKQESKPAPASTGQKETSPTAETSTPQRPENIYQAVPAPDAARSQVPAAPNSRRLARELGIDISQVPGSGPDGWVSREDVKQHTRQVVTQGGGASTGPAPQPNMPDFSKWGEVTTEKMSGIRRATAKQMDLAWSTVPHVTQFDKADVVELEKLRKRFGAKVAESGGKLTVTAILLKVVAAALKQFPNFNASIDVANQQIIYKNYYNLGLAVDTEKGLVVPVIRDVDRKSITQLSVELNEIAAKARDNKLRLEDMQGATFTITNLGGIGGTNFTPIVNWPEVAILGVARGQVEPIYNKESGEFEPRMQMPLALSYDHRIIDGADAARFVRKIVETIEEPFLMSLQGW